MTQWGWRAGLTRPQIELLLNDQPVIHYKKSKPDNKHDKDGWKKRKASKRKVQEANTMWEQKKVELDSKPKTFSLGNFNISK